jgi:hypothetical protein
MDFYSFVTFENTYVSNLWNSTDGLFLVTLGMRGEMIFENLNIEGVISQKNIGCF